MNHIHISHFAGALRCKHCGEMNSSSEWPERGDWVAFYYQAEPGNYSLVVDCPHCGKQWFVAWDEDPGPIRPLLFAEP